MTDIKNNALYIPKAVELQKKLKLTNYDYFAANSKLDNVRYELPRDRELQVNRTIQVDPAANNNRFDIRIQITHGAEFH